tara:strand:- start:411 stop:644 length:234 start_codon:yes stop_codon:yes gene_type:complete
VKKSAGKNKTTPQKIAVKFLEKFSLIEINDKLAKTIAPVPAYEIIKLCCPSAVKNPSNAPKILIQKRLNVIEGLGGI